MSEILFGIDEGIASMLWYHYGVIVSAFLLFLGFLILGIVFFKKHLVAATCFFLAFLFLLAGAPVGLIAVEDKIRDIELTDLNITTLFYSPVIVINGNIKSNAMIPVNKEIFKVVVTKYSDNWFYNIKNYLQPIKVESFTQRTKIEKEDKEPFELVVDYGDATLPKKINIYILYKAL